MTCKALLNIMHSLPGLCSVVTDGRVTSGPSPAPVEDTTIMLEIVVFGCRSWIVNEVSLVLTVLVPTLLHVYVIMY